MEIKSVIYWWRHTWTVATDDEYKAMWMKGPQLPSYRILSAIVISRKTNNQWNLTDTKQIVQNSKLLLEWGVKQRPGYGKWDKVRTVHSKSQGSLYGVYMYVISARFTLVGRKRCLTLRSQWLYMHTSLPGNKCWVGSSFSKGQNNPDIPMPQRHSFKRKELPAMSKTTTHEVTGLVGCQIGMYYLERMLLYVI